MSWLISGFQKHDRVPQNILLVSLLVFCSLLLIWQTIGGFRSATRRIEEFGSSAHYYVVLVVVLICGTSIFGKIASLSGGSIDYRQAAVDAYTPPERQFELGMNEAGVLVFNGDIDRTATVALRKIARGLNSGTQLTLNSKGGLIVEARGMANTVKEFGLHTHVNEHCYSACTLVFIAGAERSLGLQGELGFHQYDVVSQTPLPWIVLKEEQEKDLAYFQEKNVAGWFLEKAYSAAHRSIWIPRRDELIAAGIIVAQNGHR